MKDLSISEDWYRYGFYLEIKITDNNNGTLNTPTGAHIHRMLTVTDWAAIFTALASGVGVVFILFQLRHMDKHRDLEITMKLFEWAETDRLRKAFRWVETDFVFESLEKYKVDLAEKIELIDYPYQVEAYFEEVGFLVNKKFVDIDVIVDRLGSHLISNWRKLEPWILAIRGERKDVTFGEHFELLYRKTIFYMKKNNNFDKKL